jgi:hypothetical protein
MARGVRGQISGSRPSTGRQATIPGTDVFRLPNPTENISFQALMPSQNVESSIGVAIEALHDVQTQDLDGTLAPSPPPDAWNSTFASWSNDIFLGMESHFAPDIFDVSGGSDPHYPQSEDGPIFRSETDQPGALAQPEEVLIRSKHRQHKCIDCGKMFPRLCELR